MRFWYELLREWQISIVHLKYSKILMSGDYDIKLKYIDPKTKLWKWQIIDVYGTVIEEN